MLRIEKAAVLGAGTMGAQIAAHLANAGVPTILLDIVPRELTPEEQAKGLTLDSPQVRNRIANAVSRVRRKQNRLRSLPRIKRHWFRQAILKTT